MPKRVKVKHREREREREGCTKDNGDNACCTICALTSSTILPLLAFAFICV